MPPRVPAGGRAGGGPAAGRLGPGGALGGALEGGRAGDAERPVGERGRAAAPHAAAANGDDAGEPYGAGDVVAHPGRYRVEKLGDGPPSAIATEIVGSMAGLIIAEAVRSYLGKGSSKKKLKKQLRKLTSQLVS